MDDLSVTVDMNVTSAGYFVQCVVNSTGPENAGSDFMICKNCGHVLQLFKIAWVHESKLKMCGEIKCECGCVIPEPDYEIIGPGMGDTLAGGI